MVENEPATPIIIEAHTTRKSAKHATVYPAACFFRRNCPSRMRRLGQAAKFDTVSCAPTILRPQSRRTVFYAAPAGGEQNTDLVFGATGGKEPRRTVQILAR